MRMSMSMSNRSREPGSLGQIVENIYRFVSSGYDSGLRVDDRINLSDVSAGEYFDEADRGYTVKRDCLPFTEEIKGAGVSTTGNYAGRPILFLAQLDFSKLEEVLKEELGATMKVFDRGKNSNVLLGNEKFARIDYRARKRKDRTTCPISRVIFMPKFDDLGSDYAIQASDIIFSNDVFADDEYFENLMPTRNSVTVPNLKLQMRQEMTQDLRTAIQQDQGLNLSIALRQTALPLLIQQAQVLEMNDTEVQEQLAKQAQQLVNQAIARIQSIRPGISRQQAYRILSKVPKRSTVNASA